MAVLLATNEYWVGLNRYISLVKTQLQLSETASKIKYILV